LLQIVCSRLKSLKNVEIGLGSRKLQQRCDVCWGQQDATIDAALRMIDNQVTQVIHEGGIGDGDNANN